MQKKRGKCSTKQCWAGLKEYLKSHGVDTDVFDKLKSEA